MQPAMLYAREGIQLRDDAYAIEGIGREHRDVIKEGMMKLLNARSNQPIMPPVDDEGRPLTMPEGWKWKDVQRAIIDKHEPIGHWFRSGVGIELQRIDSDIAEIVMMAMMRDGILVLPIHDSFIVRREERARLEKVMKQAYRETIGFEIEVKAEKSFVDDLPASALVDGVETYMERMIQSGRYEGYRARREAFWTRQ